MKKLLCSLLACLMFVSLCACGNDSSPSSEPEENSETVDTAPTKEELLEQAKTIYEIAAEGEYGASMGAENMGAKQIKDLENFKLKNFAQFKLTYLNKICIVRGYVWKIHDEYCIISSRPTGLGYGSGVKIYLPLEELAKLQKPEDPFDENVETYDFVGEITSIEDYPIENGVNDGHLFDMTNAYCLGVHEDTDD